MLNHKTDYVRVFYLKKLPEVLILFDTQPFLLLESNIETPVIRVCGSIICETIQMNQCSIRISEELFSQRDVHLIDPKKVNKDQQGREIVRPLQLVWFVLPVEVAGELGRLCFHKLCSIDIHVNKMKFERNSSPEYYDMTCIGKTKHTI